MNYAGAWGHTQRDAACTTNYNEILAIIKETVSRAKAYIHRAAERGGEGGATVVRRGPRVEDGGGGVDKARVALFIYVAASVELYGEDEGKRCLELA